MEAKAYLVSFLKGNQERPAWVWMLLHKVGVLIPPGIILTELEKLQIEAVINSKECPNVEIASTAMIAFIRSCKK